MSLNNDLSNLFATMAAILEIKGEPVFKAIAFTKVSRWLKDSTLDLADLVATGKLADVEGIGPSSRRIIEEFIRTGSSSDFQELSKGVPAGVIGMLDIPSLGPKTISLLWKSRNITSVDELKSAIEKGELAGLKGIGEKKIAAIKEGIELRAKAGGRVGLPAALPILEELGALPNVVEAKIAGSLRRFRETIGDVDLLCAAKPGADPQSIGRAVAAFPQVQKVLAQGVTKTSIVTFDGLQVDLRIVPPANFGAALLYFTGSKEHGVRLRSRAIDQGMTLNEWGIYRTSEYDKSAKKTGEAPSVKPLASRTEADVYKVLGLPYIEPELREDRGEIDAAAAGKLPKLVELAEIRGDLHCHTTASDGANSILEMAQAAREKGYQFLAITDHSKSSVIANGLTAERLLAHVKAIHKAAEQVKGLTLLAGCEVDILADGHLDFEAEVLAELDWVVASPHVALRQDRPKATDRILRAIESRYVNVIGHPTGRMIDQREGLPLDFARIFRAAAGSGTALEINGSYPRFDLNDVAARSAAEAGVMIAVDTDAHSVGGLEQMMFGVEVARRAWLTSGQIVNCMTPARLTQFISRKR